MALTLIMTKARVIAIIVALIDIAIIVKLIRLPVTLNPNCSRKQSQSQTPVLVLEGTGGPWTRLP